MSYYEFVERAKKETESMDDEKAKVYALLAIAEAITNLEYKIDLLYQQIISGITVYKQS